MRPDELGSETLTRSELLLIAEGGYYWRQYLRAQGTLLKRMQRLYAELRAQETFRNRKRLLYAQSMWARIEDPRQAALKLGAVARIERAFTHMWGLAIAVLAAGLLFAPDPGQVVRDWVPDVTGLSAMLAVEKFPRGPLQVRRQELYRIIERVPSRDREA